MCPSAGERLIVIGPTPPPTHGVAVFTTRMLTSLRSLGLLAGHLDTTDDRSLENLGRLEFTNVRLGVWHALKLARLLVMNPGVAVYLPLAPSRWGFVRDAVLIAMARVWGRRVYVHLEGGRGLDSLYAAAGFALRWLIRTTTSSVHQVWALTPTLASECGRLFPPDRVRVVANVVEDPLPSAGERSSTALAGDAASNGLNILYLSNLIPEKGCFDLLDALDLIGEQANGWRVRMVGDAPDPSVRTAIVRRATELPDGVRVDLPGSVTGAAKEREYRWADVFVLPTSYPFEGQPLAILEALGAGLPILSTWHAGIPDTVRDHEEGMLVPPADPRALGGALVTLAEDPDLRAELGRRARQRYQSAFTPEHLELELEDLLRKAPKGGSDDPKS
jgi:glycosyltransferase involved in cell wall biosynthesis